MDMWMVFEKQSASFEYWQYCVCSVVEFFHTLNRPVISGQFLCCFYVVTVK